jgi:hypothetical protein
MAKILRGLFELKIKSRLNIVFKRLLIFKKCELYNLF